MKRSLAGKMSHMPNENGVQDMNTQEIFVAELKQAEELREAKHLLWQVYSEEMGWSPSPDNPSELRYEEQNGTFVLQDKFDEVSTWYGAYKQDELVGCIRILKRLNGKFEAENYFEIPDELSSETGVEVNRLAVKTMEKNRILVFAHLINAVGNHVLEHRCKTLFATMAYPNPGKMLQRIGLTKSENQLKYEPRDENSVYLFSSKNAFYTARYSTIPRCQQIFAGSKSKAAAISN